MTTISETRRVRFGGLSIEHDASVLEPRPWTLLQSEWAAELSGGLPPGPVLELCSGAGHIGLEVARRTGRHLVQVDASGTACGFAARNARAAGIEAQVSVLCAPIRSIGHEAGRFPLVLADPPYLPSGEVADHPADPVEAIDGGPDGLDLPCECVEVIDAVLEDRGVALVQVRGGAQARQFARRLPRSLRVVEVREHDPLRAVVALARATRPTDVRATRDRVPLHRRLDRAMDADDEHLWGSLRAAQPLDEHDQLVTLMTIHDLWMSPVGLLGGREYFQLHPAVVELKGALETRYLRRVQAGVADDGLELSPGADAVDAMRRVGAVESVPEVYRWLATEATTDQVIDFLAYEGGPDAGFDDLVSLAQVGLRGRPKVTLGANYWDEMGRGDLAQVHTVLHDDLVEAVDMPRIARVHLPVEALDRMVLGGVLATNRSLQPEFIGALGLLEMQAGPRCRAVICALERIGARAGALPFYEEHATADPRHGKEWLDHAVAPLAASHAGWGPRMVDGARWRHHVNHRFFSTIRREITRRTRISRITRRTRISRGASGPSAGRR